ncbi:hypothetical protein EMMF5_004990 [Cystobasidiomycetes sp. EMM_F5]
MPHHVRGAPSLQRTVSMPRISEQPAETVDIPIGSALEAEESAVEQTDENACSDHFYFALLELLETERAYTSDLTHLVEVYFSELASASFISTGQRCAIVRNASQLLELHQILVKEIGNATIEYRTLSKAQNLDTAGRLLNKVVKIMDAFLDAFKLMRSVYSDFCSTHAEAMDVLKTTFSNRFQSAEFEKRCSYALHHNSRLQNKLDLVDYLIKPIQRICRYPLLFQALLKHAPAEHATIIAQAYRAAAQNATSVDEAQKQQDLLNMSKKLAERMMGDVGTFARREKLTLIGTGHVVVSTQDEGQVHNVRYLGLVLYQSCLVLVWIKKAKEYHPEQFLPLESLRFHSLPDGQSLLAHSFMISQGDNRFQIGLSCKQELEIWKQGSLNQFDSLQCACLTMSDCSALTNVVRMYGQRGLLGDGDGDRKAHIENVEAWPQEGGHDVSTPAQSPTKASSSMPRMARLRKRSMSFIKPNESGTASQSLRFTSSAEQALVDLRIGDLISNNIQAVRLQNKRFPTRPSALLA